MLTVAQDVRALIRAIVALPPRYEGPREWTRLVKKTIARFARGNIAAQEERILLEEEQDEERARALAISQKWKKRAH